MSKDNTVEIAEVVANIRHLRDITCKSLELPSDPKRWINAIMDALVQLAIAYYNEAYKKAKRARTGNEVEISYSLGIAFGACQALSAMINNGVVKYVGEEQEEQYIIAYIHTMGTIIKALKEGVFEELEYCKE